MIHEKYKKLMQLFFSNEASEADNEELKLHLLECRSCKAEFEDYQRIMDLILKSPVRKVPNHLLDDARRQLRDKLRIEHSKKNFLQNIIESIKNFFATNYKYAISGAVTMAAGLVIGYFIFGSESAQVSLSGDTASLTGQFDESTQIRNIRLIDPDPSDDLLEFAFDAVKEVQVSGYLQDENIRSILMYAIMNGSNPGVRLNSINLLNTSTNEKYDGEIKEALISAVKYDSNPGVRREALKVLKTLPFDQDIKRSYLYVILNDTSSAMRIDAINELAEAGNKNVNLSPEEKNIFKDKLLQDENSYIKLRAKAVLEEYEL